MHRPRTAGRRINPEWEPVSGTDSRGQRKNIVDNCVKCRKSRIGQARREERKKTTEDRKEGKPDEKTGNRHLS